MNAAGMIRFPVFCLLALLALASALAAQEIVVYSLPQEKADAGLKERLDWEIPSRQWIPLNGLWRLKHPETGEAVGSVHLPCTFRGAERLVFEKKFDLERKAGCRYELHLGPTSGRVRVWLNDSLVYRDSKDHYPVSITLPYELLHGGQNTLAVSVRPGNRRFSDLPGFLPVNMPRLDTGILTPIYLEIKPPLCVETIRASVNPGDSLLIPRGSVSFNRPIPAGGQFRVRIGYLFSDSSGIASPQTLLSQELPVKDQAISEMALPAWPLQPLQPWSPEQPRRYWIEVSIDSAGQALDLLRRPLAIRAVHAENREFFWNREHRIVKGINYVYQNSEGSQLFDPELARKDLQDIKRRGFDAVRVILHPLPEAFYRLCDEVGLLCFQDLPISLLPARILETSPEAGSPGAEGMVSQSRKTLQRWQEHYQYLTALAERYNSLAAIGVAFSLDGESPLQRQRLRILLDRLGGTRPLPRYVSSLVPLPARPNDPAGQEIAGLLDFQIVEIVQRNEIEAEFQKVYAALEKQLFFPSAYSKALTYRIDSTTVTFDLLQIHDFYDKLTRNKLPGEFEGHFIPTYNDFYLELPSVQNGLKGEFEYNRVGLVDIKRQARDISPPSQTEHIFSPPEIGMVYEEKAARSFLYILIGFLNVVLFLISYNRYRVFRQNLAYSIRKPHGFFVNLQERISLPFKQSFFLLMAISLNGAIIYSSVAYFFRSNLLFDYLLSLIFYVPSQKQLAAHLVWNQPVFLVAVTVAIILIFYLLALAIKVLSLLGANRVRFNQALTATIWSASPFAILLPLGIFMYSILLTMKSYWILSGVLLYFHVWVYFRWINALRVLTDRLYFRVLLGFTVLFLLALGGAAYLYNQHYNAREHLQFVYHLYEFTK